MDLELLKKVSTFMKENDILELEVNSGGQEIKLRRGSISSGAGATLAGPMMMQMPQQQSVAPASAAKEELKTNHYVVTSPFVGTFYRSAGPNQDPFVEVGKIVATGDSLCIVEAMKLMNEIESDVKGRVVRILVNNATPVEFGEPLFEIEPL